MNLLLRGVVNGRDGTGRLAQVADFTVAGKTGTAQMVNPATGAYYQSRLVASFVGFLPADDPRVVILVVLYDVPRGHFGGLVAAPVFSEIASTALERLDVAPAHRVYDSASLLPFLSSAGVEASGEGAAPSVKADHSFKKSRYAAGAPAAERGKIPDFHGLSLRAALALGGANRLDLEVKGSGYVVRQEPAAGARLDSGAVQIALDEQPDIVRSAAGVTRRRRAQPVRASGPFKSKASVGSASRGQ